MFNGLFSTPEPVALMVEEAPGVYRAASDQEVVSAAQGVLAKQMRDLPLFDSPSAVRDYLRVRLPAAFEHFNEVHPHSSLRMKSPREFKRQQVEQLRRVQSDQPALHCV